MNSNNQKRGNFISVLAVYFAANVIFIMSPAAASKKPELFRPSYPYCFLRIHGFIISNLLCSIHAGCNRRDILIIPEDG